MKAYDVTLWFPESDDVERELTLQEVQADFPGAAWTEIGAAQRFVDGEWLVGDRMWIDTVFYTGAANIGNRQDIIQQLIEHDGYPPNTEVFQNAR